MKSGGKVPAIEIQVCHGENSIHTLHLIFIQIGDCFSSFMEKVWNEILWDGVS